MASTPVPDLELTLTATESGDYGMDLRLLSPDADAVLHFHSETPVSFDLAALDSHLDDDTKYGELLGRMLLADPDTLSFFKEKRAIALDKYGLLRVRLLIRDDALQGIRWERLRVPGDDGFLAALGSSMAQAGVPAVIAMQGNVATTTVATFMPILFEELARDRQIDQAMAAVRGAVPQEEGSWVPVLFMNSRSGRLFVDHPEDKNPAARQVRTVTAGPGGVNYRDHHGDITIRNQF